MTLTVYNPDNDLVHYKLIRLKPREFEELARTFKGLINLVPLYCTQWRGAIYITPKLPKGWKVYRRC